MTNILLVEDDETILFGIESALKRKGYVCTGCASVRQAKELFPGGFQLVLLDLNLPDGSGYDFCRWVKERADTPVIFLTVRDDVRDITRGLIWARMIISPSRFMLRFWSPELRLYSAARPRMGEMSSPAGISGSIRRK